MRYLLFLGFAAMVYSNENFVLIGNQNFPVKHLLKEQVKQIYLKRIHFIKDVSIIPINYIARDPLRKNFEKNILHISSKKLNRYWIKKHYLGIRPPLIQSSIESAIIFVKKVDGAVVYIPQSKLPSDVHVLYKSQERSIR